MKQTMIRRIATKPMLFAMAGVGLLATVLLVRGFAPSKTPESAYHIARTGSFLVSVVEGGTLEAVSEVSVRSEVEGSARIIKLVPEGTFVQKGDLICELDASSVEDQVYQQQLAVEKAQLAFVQAKETLDIQRSTTNSEISAAVLKFKFAESDLKKYIEGEYPQARLNAGLEITNIMEQLEVAKDRLEWSERLFKKGFETKSKVDTDRLAFNQQQMRLIQARENLRLLEEYDHPKLTEQYSAAVDEAKRELERVLHQAASRIAQYTADVETQRRTLEYSKTKLQKLEQQLAATKIEAPQAGLVVYPSASSRFSNESMIEEGATVRNRQEIIKLPDTSRMKVSVKVHESHINQIRAGLPAFVVLDSMPDQRFRAVVNKVGLLPDTQSRWGNPNLKVYATEILITDTLPDVKPGVSATAEIVVTNLENVLTVPIQAITTLKGRQVAYIADGSGSKPVPVDIGLFNTKHIQITSGLKEGDRVLLSPPLSPDSDDLAGAIIAHGENLTNIVVPAAPPAGAAPTPSLAQVGESGRIVPPENLENGSARTGERSGPRNGFSGRSPGGDAAGPADGEGRSQRRGEGRFSGPGGEGRPGGGGRFNREEMIKQWDKDGDGELDETERAAMREQFARRRANQEGGGGQPGASPGPGPQRTESPVNQ